MTNATLFDRIWDSHVVRELGGGWALLHVDRHLLHDLTGSMALQMVEQRGMAVRNPELCVATPDHAVSSEPGRTGVSLRSGAHLWQALRDKSHSAGIRFFELGEPGHGIVHVMAPELGLVLPGALLVCGDSHTCTNGGVGALAFGIGTSEVAHVLATQTIRQRKPKSMRVRFTGKLQTGVTSKDLMLHLIGKIGTSAGTGYAIEFAGEAIEAMGMDGRLTVCNLAIELGAKVGMVAPDETTFEWLAGRPYAPRGALLEAALANWRKLRSGPEAVFDREEEIDAAQAAPNVTWGTSPEQTIAVDGTIPAPRNAQDRDTLAYMGLEAGQPLAGTPIDLVFIGSCTNGRLSDLREAAALARGRHVAPGVRAWVVPGSENVKRDAQAEGLDRIFIDAGFEWREPGCSMCAAANGETLAPKARSVSTTNRNFVGRQGPQARTHLASPAAAVAAAVRGVIADPRTL